MMYPIPVDIASWGNNFATGISSVGIGHVRQIKRRRPTFTMIEKTLQNPAK